MYKINQILCVLINIILLLNYLSMGYIINSNYAIRSNNNVKSNDNSRNIRQNNDILIKNCINRNNKYSSLMFSMFEFVDEDVSDDTNDTKTDEEKGLTHGYEGEFKIGDVVRVKKHIKIYSVKLYSKDGFDAYDMVGKIASLALYGRKLKTLCSAITPIRVEFQPSGGVPTGMFEKKWIAHFNADELELISR